MNILCLPTNQIYSYALTGKFKAPSSEWKHQNFRLTDYELFVMTEGILYLNYNHEKFIVKKGEYLLLPPSSSWRQGFKPSYCAFYWLHFATQPGELPLIITPETILPPPRPIFYAAPDRNYTKAGTSGNFNETITGYRQKQIPGNFFKYHVHKHPDGALWTAYSCTAHRKLFRKPETNLL